MDMCMRVYIAALEHDFLIYKAHLPYKYYSVSPGFGYSGLLQGCFVRFLEDTGCYADAALYFRRNFVWIG